MERVRTISAGIDVPVTVAPGSVALLHPEPAIQPVWRERILSSLRNGLPTLPFYLFELNRLLSEPNSNLGRVASVVRMDPSLAAQVLQACNTTLESGAKPIARIDVAVKTLGRQRLAMLVMTRTLVQSNDGCISEGELKTFWQHSRLAAQIAERLAAWTGYPDPDRAYMAALLHDIGVLPFLSLAACDHSAEIKPRLLEGALAEQRNAFGIDHCELGRWIASSWNLSPELAEAIEFHHQPHRATVDPALTGIVAAADQICCSRGVALGSGLPQFHETVSGTLREIIEKCRPDLPAENIAETSRLLKKELFQVIQGLDCGTAELGQEKA